MKTFNGFSAAIAAPMHELNSPAAKSKCTTSFLMIFPFWFF
jgi:hypothetical protein